MTVKDGVRASTANAYLKPAMKRANLRVITHALATRIAERSGGVPFFVVGCAQALADDTAQGGEVIPWDAAQGIRQRVAALPTPAHEVLGTAAIAVGRTHYLFFGSDVGGETAAVLYSFVQTCKWLEVEPWHYLRDVLERLPSHPPQRLAELLPDEWARAQRGVTEASLSVESNEAVPPPSG